MTNFVRVLYYLSKMLRGPYTHPHRLARYRDKMVKDLMKYSYSCVPFYHKWLKEQGVRPSDIATVDDLNKLPVLRKDEIRKNVSSMISTRHEAERLNKQWTSGSTGQPLVFYISDSEDDFRKAKHLRGNVNVGQRPTHRWVTITPPLRFTNISQFQRSLRLFAPIPLSVFSSPAAHLSKIEEIQPDLIDGYSSSILLLANEAEKKGVDSIKPRLVFGGAELTDDASRRYIERVFNAPFYDRYATVELERVAWQCPEKKYHIDADTLVLQFLDRNGEEVSAGERGEVVCTSLFNYAMPFIRYAVGDVGVPSDEECHCGRTFPLMKVIEGRKDSLAFLPDGRLLSPRMFTIAMRMFELYKDIDQFRIVQKRLDLFQLLIKKSGDVDEDVLQTKLETHIRKVLNINDDQIEFRVRLVDDIPLDKSGKLMAVVSEVKKPE